MHLDLNIFLYKGNSCGANTGGTNYPGTNLPITSKYFFILGYVFLGTHVEVDLGNLHFLFLLAANPICTNKKDCVAAVILDHGGYYKAGGKGYPFESPNHPIKGCYSYWTGPFKGHVYYGTGGTINRRKAELHPPYFRLKSAWMCDGKNYAGDNPDGTDDHVRPDQDANTSKLLFFTWLCFY